MSANAETASRRRPGEWAPDHPSFWHASALEGLRVDMAIVGAGICGVSAAVAALELEPKLKIVLLDPWGVAGAASGRNAGFVLAGSDASHAKACEVHGREKARLLRRFTVMSVARVADLVRRFEIDCDFKLSGSHVVAASPEEDRELRASAEMLREDGFEGVEYLEKAPFGKGFLGALRNPADGEIHPVKYLRGLARAAGLRVEQARALGFRRHGAEGGFEIETDQGTVRCGKLLACANAFLPRLFPNWAPERVRPVRAQMLATAPLSKRLFEGVAYCDYGHDYFRQLADGRLLMGGRRHLHAEEEVGYGLDTTEALQADLLAFLEERFPEAAPFKVAHRWAGTMGFSSTGLPFIGQAPGGVFVAGGFTGHGMSYGTQAGLELASLALRGAPSETFPLEA